MTLDDIEEVGPLQTSDHAELCKPLESVSFSSKSKGRQLGFEQASNINVF